MRPQLMELLVSLAERPGDVVLKDEILERVWGGRFVSESCLTRSISELRDILKADSDETPCIETIPKRGYRLCAPVLRNVADILPADESRTGVVHDAGQTNVAALSLLAGSAFGLLVGLFLNRKR